MQQVEMVSLEDLIPENHNYRKFTKLWDCFELKDFGFLKKIEKLFFSIKSSARTLSNVDYSA